MNFRHNKTTRKLEPKISADDKERLRKAMKMGTESLFDEDDNEVDDKQYFLDDISDKKRDTDFEKKQQVQFQRDNARIGLVYQALSMGVELEGDHLYYEMLETYPFF